MPCQPPVTSRRPSGANASPVIAPICSPARVIRQAFADGWVLESLDPVTYRGIVTEVHAEALDLPVGTRVDEPAWLARARHIPGGRS